MQVLGPQKSLPHAEALVVLLKDRHVEVRLAGVRALSAIGHACAGIAGDELDRTYSPGAK